MRKHLLLLTLVYPLAGSAPRTDKTLVNVTVNEATVYVGKNTLISIWVEVKRGYHIQANKVDDEFLVPTTLEVNDVKGITISKQEFPSAKPFKLEGTDSFLSVYDGKFLIKLTLAADAKMKTGNYELKAKLHYQACDSRSCLFPRALDFSIPVEVKMDGQR